MRTVVLLPLLSIALGACGNAASFAKASPPHDVPLATTSSVVVETPIETKVEPKPASPLGARIGALDHAPALKRFFESLARLETGHEHEDVRIVQFGDSHTAADCQSGAVRRALQARFGDGGRGFVAIGSAYPHYFQPGVHVGMDPAWKAEHGKYARGHFFGDGEYGLAGMAIETSKPGARAWTELAAHASKVELAYLAQPQGGSIDLYADGVKLGRVSTRAPARGSGFQAFGMTDGPHRIEARAVGDGEARLFGIALDRTQVGVTYDALGINGARVTTALQWNEAHMAEQLEHRAPSLIILAYGTNEAGDDTPAETYEREIVDLLGRMARAVPTAACMLLGPPDRAIKNGEAWETSPRLLERIASQERVAEAAGCAFYSQFEAMGGAGTIAQWADESPPRARKDHVHLTQAGYELLGDALAADLLRAYALWRGEPAPVAAPSAQN